MRRKKHVQSTSNAQEFALGYTFRGLKDELNAIAASSGGTVSAIELAGRLAELLGAETRRGLLGNPDGLSVLRGESTKARRSLAKKKVAGRTHNDNAPARKVGRPPKKRHWTQLPKNRARVLKHLKVMRKIRGI